MKNTRKDWFIAITAMVWLIANLVAYFVSGLVDVAYVNVSFIIILILVLNNDDIMKWLNKK